MTRMNKRPCPLATSLAVTLSALFVLAAPSPAADADGPSALERRWSLLDAFRQEGAGAVPALAAALDDEALFVRRTAAHLLVRLGEPALPGVERALQNPDFQVRRIAMDGLQKMGVLQRYWEVVQKDEHPSIQREIQQMQSEQVAEFALPAEGWKFKLDPEDAGREGGWFAADHDDADWMDARIEASWNDFLPERYIGVAWYRRAVDVPRIAGDVLHLDFGGVDESAWVWVNGEYAGEHDVGPGGWNLSFRIDVTRLVKPGERNVIAVRAMNTAGEGGIWRPITLRAFEDLR